MLNKSQSDSLYRYKIKLMLALEKKTIFKQKNNTTVRKVLVAFLDKLFEHEVNPNNIIDVSTSLHVFENVKDASYFFLFLMCDLIHDVKNMEFMKQWTGVDIVGTTPINLLIGFVWNLYSVHPAAMALIINFLSTDEGIEKDAERLLGIKNGTVGAGSGVETKMLNVAKKYIPNKKYYKKIPVSRSRKDYSVIFDQSSKGTVTTISQTRTDHIVLGIPVDADKGLTQPDNASSSLTDIVYRFMRDHSYHWLLSKDEERLAEYMASHDACKKTKKQNVDDEEAVLRMFNKFVFNIADRWISRIQLKIPNLESYDIFTNIYELSSVRLIKGSIQRFSYYSENNKNAWAKLDRNTEKLQALNNAVVRNQKKNAIKELMETNINDPPFGFGVEYPLSAAAAKNKPTLQEALLKTITDLNLMYYAREVSKVGKIGLTRYATGDRSAAAVCMFLNNVARQKPAVNNVNQDEPGFPYIFEESKVEILESKQYPDGLNTSSLNSNNSNYSEFNSNTFNVPPELPMSLMGTSNLNRKTLNNYAVKQANSREKAAEMHATIREIKGNIPKNVTTLTPRRYKKLLNGYEQLTTKEQKAEYLIKSLTLTKNPQPPARQKPTKPSPHRPLFKPQPPATQKSETPSPHQSPIKPKKQSTARSISSSTRRSLFSPNAAGPSGSQTQTRSGRSSIQPNRFTPS